MKCTVIYEKKRRGKPSSPSFPQGPAAEALLKNLMAIPIPQRQESAMAFIDTAISISEDYDIDLSIWKYDTFLSAHFYFDSAGAMGFLKNIMQYADDLTFFATLDGYEICMHVDYYTHEIYRNNRKLFPLEW